MDENNKILKEVRSTLRKIEFYFGFLEHFLL